MNAFGEILIYFILEPLAHFLFAIPGAFIRWLFSRIWNSSTTFYYYARVEPWTSGVIGLVVISTTGILIASGS